ncbi:acyltransferase [Blastococcus montanus]|uniref:acyltransferase family protein n=1 Tax=Blastococcus montanus TaxID=3144973 RepID=UPI003208235F
MRNADAATDGLRLRALDGLRFIAAFAVVAFHFTGRDSPGWDESVSEVFPRLSAITVYGGFGPYLFFMISGFVILMSAWGRSMPSFIASRIGRLYPAYWAAVVIIAIVLWIFPIMKHWEGLGLEGVLVNLTMFQTAFGVEHVDGVFWTLWIELKFYVLLALVGLAGGFTRGRMLLFCLAWPLLGAMVGRTPLGIAFLEPTYAPFFCIGIVLYLARRFGWDLPTGLILGVNIVTALWICKEHYIPWSERVAGVEVTMGTLTLVMLGCVGAVVLATLTPVARLDWRWLTTAGALTYPLYLVHEIPGWVLIQQISPVLPAYATLAVVTSIVLVAAYAIYRLVEVPFGPRLRRAVERDLARIAAPTPVAETPAAASTSFRSGQSINHLLHGSRDRSWRDEVPLPTSRASHSRESAQVSEGGAAVPAADLAHVVGRGAGRVGGVGDRAEVAGRR